MEKIAVIGIGKLGLCIALQLERAGYNVLGIDENIDYVQSINNKSLLSFEPGVESALHTAIHFHATHNIEKLLEFDPQLIFIAVSTPTSPTDAYDHSNVDKVLNSLFTLNRASLRRDIVIICTTLPGYCDSKAGEAARYNYCLSYKPEFIAQGTIMHDLQNPDQIIIGEGDIIAGDKISEVYSKLSVAKHTVLRMSRLSAEISKLATNCYLTMKISFANAIGDLSTQTGAEPEKILSAIGCDSRIGSRFLKYGFGFGGPCFPRDNRALHYFSEQNGLPLFQSLASDNANEAHLNFMFKEYMKNHGPAESIHFYSVTYKPGTVILEESQQLALAVRLAHAGRKIVIHEDPKLIEDLQNLYGDLFHYVKH